MIKVQLSLEIIKKNSHWLKVNILDTLHDSNLSLVQERNIKIEPSQVHKKCTFFIKTWNAYL